MDEKLNEAIARMADQTKSCQDSLKAMQFSQAALNLANAKATIETIPAITGVEPKPPAKKSGAGA